MVNNRGFIIHKSAKKKEKDMTMIFIKRIILLHQTQVVNVFDLGYLGIEKDFPEQLLSLPNRKKRNKELSKRKKNTTKVILKKE